MSSRSASQTDFVVIGGVTALPYVAALSERGASTTWLRLRSRGDQLDRFPVYYGNGECWENARLVYGEATAALLWDISRRNFERVARSGYARPGRILWFASDEREAGLLVASAKAGGTYVRQGEWLMAGKKKFIGSLQEPFLALDVEAMRRRALEAGVRSLGADKIDAIESAGTLSTRIRATGGGAPIELTASMVIVATDEIPRSLLPSLADKTVPVTLSWVRRRGKGKPPAEAALFHLGADFALAENDGRLRLGSYRNLYEDRAVGVHDTADKVTRESVGRYFTDLDWIEGDEEEAGVTVESLGCDGLPVVGALPDLPGVFYSGGFGGRTMNFLFEVSALLADGMLKGRGFTPLDKFSTKRFT